MFRLTLPSSQLIQSASRQLARSSRGRLPSQPNPARRTLTTHTLTLSTTRPTVLPSASQTTCSASVFAPTSGTADLVPTAAISSHPALLQSQIRCGPRATMAKTSRLIQKRRHGFLSRIRTAKGRKTIARRRAKGRLRVAVA